MSEIIIRMANLDDGEAISKLNNVAQKLHAQAMPNLFKQPSKDTFPPSEIKEILDQEEKYIFLAVSNDKPVGYIYFSVELRTENTMTYATERIRIHHISIAESFQSKGVGKKLLQTAMSFAEDRSISIISFDVWAFNEKAKAFFESHGFTVFNMNMGIGI